MHNMCVLKLSQYCDVLHTHTRTGTQQSVKRFVLRAHMKEKQFEFLRADVEHNTQKSRRERKNVFLFIILFLHFFRNIRIIDIDIVVGVCFSFAPSPFTEFGHVNITNSNGKKEELLQTRYTSINENETSFNYVNLP